MVTREDHVDGSQPNYLQVAKPLREKLNGFLGKLRRLLYMEASHKVDSYDLMNLVLWESLPRELLVLVLARLPVPKITRLRCQLSKELTINMEFNQACDEVNPNMVALVSYPLADNEFTIKIFDFSKLVCLYVYRFHLAHWRNAPSGVQIGWKPMASDGGLICFVSTNKYTKANPLCIVVINPLTRAQHELPPLQYVYTTPPILVVMKVDSKTKGYKVVVVGKLKDGRHPIETYHSVSEQWSTSTPSWDRGCEYKSCHCNLFHFKSFQLCAIDFEQKQLEFLNSNILFKSEGASMVQYAFAGDRMFALYKKLNQHNDGSGFYFITEYQSQNNAKVWVPVKTHNQCFPKGEYKLFDLHACEDVVVIQNHFNNTNGICRIMNFSTNKWHNLLDNSPEDRYVSLMCRVSWNVIP